MFVNRFNLIGSLNLLFRVEASDSPTPSAFGLVETASAYY